MAESPSPSKPSLQVAERPQNQRRNRQPVASKAAAGRTTLRPQPRVERPAGRLSWFTWDSNLSHADQERAKERLAVLVLSTVLVLVVLLVGGALVWDKLVMAQRPVAQLDGRGISLRTYTDVLAYRENVLQAQLRQAQDLASRPTSTGTDGSSNDFLQQFARQQLQQIQNQLAGLSTKLVDDLIDDQLIRAEAAKRSLTTTPQEIDEALKQLIGYQQPTPVATPLEGASDGSTVPASPSPPATAAPTGTPRPSGRRSSSFEPFYRDYQRVTAGTNAVIRADVESEILRRKLSEQLAAAVPPRAEQVHAQHILVADETAARAVLERLNNGESFETLAAELSTDTSNKDNGGDLGWFPRGIMIPEFEDAVFKLQAGQTSAPVTTSFGAHIIRVDERDSDRELTTEQLQTLKNGAVPRWLETEKKPHKIEYLLTADMQDWAARNARKPSFPSGYSGY